MQSPPSVPLYGGTPDQTSLTQWAETARRDGSPGGLGDPDQRPSWQRWRSQIPLSALLMAAAATTTLRLGTHVITNDFRNPVMLAPDGTTIDVVSDERFEFGLGTGWNADDYAALGIPIASPGTRVGRLEEAVALIMRLFREETVTFAGTHYTAQNAKLNPKSVHSSHQPLFIRHGGRAAYRWMSVRRTSSALIRRGRLVARRISRPRRTAP